jgi:hypothetical protein
MIKREDIPTWLQAVSAAAQVVAVIIGGYWVYHIHNVTGETDENINVTVEATSLPYSSAQRFLVVHVRPKNVGKVPVTFKKPDDLRVIVKRIPDALGAGTADVDALPVTVEKEHMLSRPSYGDEYELDPGVEFDEVAAFVVVPGTYYIEAELQQKVGLDDTYGDQTVVRIE